MAAENEEPSPVNAMTSRQRVLAALSDDAVPDRVPWVEQVVHANVLGALTGRELSDPLRDESIVRHRVFDYYAEAGDVLAKLGLDGLGCPCWTPTIADPVVVDGQIVPRAHQPGILDWATFNARTKTIPRPGNVPFAEYVEPWFDAMDRHNLFRVLVVGMQYRMSEVSVGFENMAFWHVDHPDLLHAAARFFCDWTCEALRMILDRCAFDAVWLDDDLAYKGGTFVSPDWLREYTFPYHRQIVEVAHSYGLPALFHSDGNLGEIIEDLIDAGFVSIHPLERLALDIRTVRREVGCRVTLMGNVDIDFLERGDPSHCYDEAASLIRELGPRRFILASGNCITANVKADNLREMARAVREQPTRENHRNIRE